MNVVHIHRKGGLTFLILERILGLSDNGTEETGAQKHKPGKFTSVRDFF